MARDRHTEIERRRFLLAVAALGLPLGVPLAVPRSASGAASNATEGSSGGDDTLPTPRHEPAAFPRNDPARVQAVVGSSHGNFDAVRELVTEQPALAKASWDWGFGDWETALGAASHTGRRQIAEFLIAHGAQPTVFSAAMLGDVDTVRAFLAADASVYRLPGPHGITLLAHAQAGGPDAERVVDFLSARFGADDAPAHVTGDAEVEARYSGRYSFPTDPPTEIGVAVRNGFLLAGAGEQPNSRLVRLDEHAFHPTGATGVRLRFDVVEGRARTLTIEDGALAISGARVTP